MQSAVEPYDELMIDSDDLEQDTGQVDKDIDCPYSFWRLVRIFLISEEHE